MKEIDTFYFRKNNEIILPIGKQSFTKIDEWVVKSNKRDKPLLFLRNNNKITV